MRVQRVGSLLTAFFVDGPVRGFTDVRRSNTEQYAAFFNAMLERGVYLAPSQFEAMFVSLAHAESHIDATLDAADASLAKIASYMVNPPSSRHT